MSTDLTDIMRRMRAAGISDRAIAALLGIDNEADSGRKTIWRLLGKRDDPRPVSDLTIPEIPPPETFAAFLRAFRARHGLTQYDLAKLLGVTTTGKQAGTVSKWENGHKVCDYPTPMMGYLLFLEKYSLTRNS